MKRSSNTRGSMDMKRWISCDPGSRGSSTGSRTFEYCYPRECPRDKAFGALGSKGSSTSDFLAESQKLCKGITKGTNITDCGNELENSATRCYLQPSKPHGSRVLRGSSCGFYCYPYCYPCYPKALWKGGDAHGEPSTVTPATRNLITVRNTTATKNFITNHNQKGTNNYG